MAPHHTIPIPSINKSRPPSLTPEIRSALLTALMSSSAIPKIHTTLLSSCQSTGWLDAVRERALQLLRSGECTSYREIMAVLRDEVRAPLPQANEAGGGGGGQEDGNNAGERGRVRRRKGGREEEEEEEEEYRVINVRIPAKVYNDGVRAVRKALEAVVDVVD